MLTLVDEMIGSGLVPVYQDLDPKVYSERGYNNDTNKKKRNNLLKIQGEKKDRMREHKALALFSPLKKRRHLPFWETLVQCLIKMEAEDAEETLKLLDSSLSSIKWRMRPSSKRRLETGLSSFFLSNFAVSSFQYYIRIYTSGSNSNHRKQCSLTLEVLRFFLKILDSQ